ncbi:MAG: M67 family metallopeptidase [Nitrospirota bacterium]|nr:M67 family metallopeptidase [Nitrospirota bacterium]
MEEIFLPRYLAEDLLIHCRSVFPEEACGLVGSAPSGHPSLIIPITNSLHSPVRYQMDTREQFDGMKRLRKEGLILWAIFHSHPMSEAYPSPTDLRLAFYPDCYYLIAGLSTDPPSIRCYSMIDGNIDEHRLKITD